MLYFTICLPRPSISDYAYCLIRRYPKVVTGLNHGPHKELIGYFEFLAFGNVQVLGISINVGIAGSPENCSRNAKVPGKVLEKTVTADPKTARFDQIGQLVKCLIFSEIWHQLCLTGYSYLHHFARQHLDQLRPPGIVFGVGSIVRQLF